MHDNEKAQIVAQMLLPEIVDEASLLPYIKCAEDLVLAKRYPFGYPHDADAISVPSRFEGIQCQIALELWTRRGAEGETAHVENGISRTWAGSVISPTLLKMVTPLVGSVVTAE